MTFSRIISDIHSVLTDDLLKPEYRKMEKRHLTTGHCYAASEALFHLFGGKDVWSAYCGRDHTGGTHWWLKNKLTGIILDPTSEQYTHFGNTPPYANGKPCAFLTRQPSKRAKEILKRLASLI